MEEDLVDILEAEDLVDILVEEDLVGIPEAEDLADIPEADPVGLAWADMDMAGMVEVAEDCTDPLQVLRYTAPLDHLRTPRHHSVRQQRPIDQTKMCM